MGKELRNGGTLSGAVKIGAKAAVEKCVILFYSILVHLK